jgi:hypothetical protein
MCFLNYFLFTFLFCSGFIMYFKLFDRRGTIGYFMYRVVVTTCQAGVFNFFLLWNDIDG